MTPTNHALTIHIIPNAHLDPVWLWDWRDGYTEAITTTRTILDLMDEYPELTFIRGEAFHYRYIEQTDPATFDRLKARIAEGRWDVVGGMMLQSDMNMPHTETFARQITYAQRYFQAQFGRTARVGWSADCFGHAAGMVDILAAGGMEYYAYTRPKSIPLASTFWWESASGARLLTHHPSVGWYGAERDEMPRRLDDLLVYAESVPFRNILCFAGLGNHGGHPSRRMIADIRTWADAHPDVRVEYSGLTRYFDTLRAELATLPADAIPSYRGELNPSPRGVYALGARFKFAYRHAEAGLLRADRMASLVAATGIMQHSPNTLREAWEAVLYNTFHDILPGSSIERAMNEQLEWLSLTPHTARLTEQRLVNALSAHIDTQVRPPQVDMPSGVPFLLFNPHPWAFDGLVELETNLDYRPVWKYLNRSDDMPVIVRGDGLAPLPLQKIEAEHLYWPECNIRTRVLVPVQIPACGWQVVEYAYEEGASTIPVTQPTQGDPDGRRIENDLWQVEAIEGSAGVRLWRNGISVFGDAGLSVITVEDPWGCWGDFHESEEAANLVTVRHHWRITRSEVVESGPLRSTLCVRMEGGNSRMDLRFSLASGREAVDVSVRVLWDERSAQLKLVLPGAFRAATYRIPAGEITRGAAGDVVGGQWVKLDADAGGLGFASDALYGFNLTPEGDFQAAIARATRYSADKPSTADQHPWRPVFDQGVLSFRFLLTGNIDRLVHLAAELEQPPLVAPVTPRAGTWERRGGLCSLSSDSLQLLAIKPAEDGNGWIVRLQKAAMPTGQPDQSNFQWMGTGVDLPSLPPNPLVSMRLTRQSDGTWMAQACDLLENPLP